MSSKLIVALDVNDLNEAKNLVTVLGDSVNYYKVGLELFLNTGGKVLEFLKDQKKKIFLDLKFHDIPNTVAQAAKWATTLGVDMFNVHASGGREMLQKVSEVVSETAKAQKIDKPLVIAVTILTSFNEEGITEVGYNGSIENLATNLAKLTKEGGLDGVVCSPKEVENIKKVCGREFITVCPGVRPKWSVSGDQKRIMTPKDAIEIGADFLVVGRPITKSNDPYEAAMKIINEMEQI
ncbi:orotidine-5'-phosphate decarboxylase [Desulfonispora thiosulfatigenes DSM 11270]|uniref:Orotidine 5'-phosphate decarboxylase n=1 Tax=Desulfonispora thiosulfatigenes DSM 11270 TaxID=656914 RepID=A0A1W1VHT8_DESTI|nr:orotidine-5'-phosphate decarboxylase [Desulfonispora thiosulfatigenes]SMB92621.1 orotidine-5'-phosphate decarboxylase [Desulfonispora thiosulfatigenes DSM 11270]